MSDFTVYSIPGSPFGRAVLAALELKGAPYRLEPVAPGTLQEEAHRSRHPFGRIPALRHGDFMLYETQAILRYIDRVLVDPPLTPRDPQAAARMDQLMNINDWYLFQGCNRIIGFERVVKPRLLGLETDEAAVAAAMPDAHRVFDELGRLLGDQKFLTGDRLSLADLPIAAQLDFLPGIPEWPALTDGNPNLVAWLGRMQNIPAMQATTWEKLAALVTMRAA